MVVYVKTDARTDRVVVWRANGETHLVFPPGPPNEADCHEASALLTDEECAYIRRHFGALGPGPLRYEWASDPRLEQLRPPAA